MRRFGPLTREDWITSHALTIASSPGSDLRPFRRGQIGSALIGEPPDPRSRVRFARVACPHKAGAPWLLARVDLDTGEALVRNVPTGELFTSTIAELAESARAGAETYACQRWQVRHALRLRRLCRRLGMRLHACHRGTNPLAGSGYPLNSRLHPALGVPARKETTCER